MNYHKTITLKDGKTCVIRNGTAEDGQALLDIFNLTHAQTDYLLTYPEESTHTVQQEAAYLQEKAESADEIEILAEIGGNYLKAYAFDCILTAFLFCFLGFYNGIGLTRFVMVQGIIGAFLIRIPIAWLMSRVEPVNVFLIGIATPISTVFQDLMCLGCLIYVYRKFIPRK